MRILKKTKQHNKFGDKKKKKGGGEKESIDECVIRPLYLAFTKLLALTQILGLTFFSNLFILTSRLYPFSICLSFFSFKGKSLSEEDSIPNYVCIQLRKQRSGSSQKRAMKSLAKPKKYCGKKSSLRDSSYLDDLLYMSGSGA